MGAFRKAPKASHKKRSTTLRHLFDLDSEADGVTGAATTLRHLFDMDSEADGVTGAATVLPPPPQPPEPETDELISMIAACTGHLPESSSPSQQELKAQQLSRILSIVRPMKDPPPDDRVMSRLFAMVAANLFRPLPPPSTSYHPVLSHDSAIDDDEAPVSAPDPSWPHLHVVYEILSAAVAAGDAKALRRHVGGRGFLLGLVALFQSEDPRERERLKRVYHQIYAKLVPERPFMRRSTADVLLRFALEADRDRWWHCGVGELLEIWGSIIEGFAVPLKEEHGVFLRRVLVPLHRPRGMHVYHRQLAYCVCQFVRKEPGLAGAVVRGILGSWPVSNSRKEVLLIGELEGLVESLEPGRLGEVAVPLCSRIARCMSSCSSQVAERALCVWYNEHFMRMASQSAEKILPAMVESVEKNLRSHWSKSVQQVTASVKMLLEEMEPGLYSRCLRELDLKESVADQEELKRRRRWEVLEMALDNR